MSAWAYGYTEHLHEAYGPDNRKIHICCSGYQKTGIVGGFHWTKGRSPDPIFKRCFQVSGDYSKDGNHKICFTLGDSLLYNAYPTPPYSEILEEVSVEFTITQLPMVMDLFRDMKMKIENADVTLIGGSKE